MKTFLLKYLNNYIGKFINLYGKFDNYFIFNLVNYALEVMRNLNIFTEDEIKEGKANSFIDFLILKRINDDEFSNRCKELSDRYKELSDGANEAGNEEDEKRYRRLFEENNGLFNGNNSLSNGYNALSSDYEKLFNIFGIDLSLDINIDDLGESDFITIRKLVNVDDSNEDIKKLSDDDKKVLLLLKKLHELGVKIFELSLEEIKQQYTLIKTNLSNLDFPVELFVNIDFLSDEIFQNVRNLAVEGNGFAGDSNKEKKYEIFVNDFHFRVFVLLKLFSKLGYDISSMDLESFKKEHRILKEKKSREFKELLSGVVPLRNAYKHSQFEALRNALGNDYSKISDDLFEMAIKSFLFEYRGILKFDEDLSSFKEDFRNKFKLYFHDSFIKKFIFENDEMLEKLYGDISQYNSRVKFYVRTFVSSFNLRNYHFGDEPNRRLNGDSIKKAINMIKDKIRIHLASYDDLPDDKLDSIVEKIMIDESVTDILDLIMKDNKSDKLSSLLRILIDGSQKRNEPRIIPLVKSSSSVVDEKTENYIRNYIKKYLNKNDAVSLDDCINYVLSSSTFEGDIDSTIRKLCIEYYVKEYLKRNKLDASDEMVELILKGLSPDDYFPIFNGVRDGKILYLYNSIMLKTKIVLYFQNNNIENVSDKILDYIFGRLNELDDSFVSQHGGYDKIIGNIYSKVLDAKDYIRKYLHRNNFDESEETIDYIFECFSSYGCSLSSVIKGTRDIEIESHYKKKCSVNDTSVLHTISKHPLFKPVMSLLLVVTLLGGAGVTTKKKVERIKDDRYEDFLDNSLRFEYSVGDLNEFLGRYTEGLSYDDDSQYLDNFITFYEKLTGCGEDYWMLIFSEAEKVLDEHQMDEFVSDFLKLPNVPQGIRRMFMIGNELVPTYGSWKLNCMIRSEQPLPNSEKYMCTEIRQYYYANNPSSTGTLVPFENVDMNALNRLNESYESLIESVMDNFKMYLSLKNGNFDDFFPEWLIEKLEEKYGVFDELRGAR